MSTEELVEEKNVKTEQYMTSEPFRELTHGARKTITVFVLIIGVLIGVGILLSRQRLEIFITLKASFFILHIGSSGRNGTSLASYPCKACLRRLFSVAEERLRWQTSARTLCSRWCSLRSVLRAQRNRINFRFYQTCQD